MAENSLKIQNWQNDTHDFVLEGQNITIRQSVEKLGSSVQALHLEFELSSPVRFSVRTMIPPDSINACVVLNQQLLISPCGGQWPQEAPDLNLSDCQKKGESISTIKPGEFQKISFSWHNNDHLIFYIVTQ